MYFCFFLFPITDYFSEPPSDDAGFFSVDCFPLNVFIILILFSCPPVEINSCIYSALMGQLSSGCLFFGFQLQFITHVGGPQTLSLFMLSFRFDAEEGLPSLTEHARALMFARKADDAIFVHSIE